MSQLFRLVKIFRIFPTERSEFCPKTSSRLRKAVDSALNISEDGSREISEDVTAFPEYIDYSPIFIPGLCQSCKKLSSATNLDCSFVELNYLSQICEPGGVNWPFLHANRS